MCFEGSHAVAQHGDCVGPHCGERLCGCGAKTHVIVLHESVHELPHDIRLTRHVRKYGYGFLSYAPVVVRKGDKNQVY